MAMRSLVKACTMGLLLSGVSTAVDAQTAAIHDLISVERALTAMCRAWSSDDKHTDEVCHVRDKMGEALNKLGYCYGKEGQVGMEMEWRKCTQHSRR
jgi:hypothetical protein